MDHGLDVVSLFEYPLPVLSTSLDRIDSESSGHINGSFNVRNKGGGNLAGRILSNSKALTFIPDIFSGRNIVINYHIDISALKPGDELRTSAVVMTNGGEKTIPVTVKIVPTRIETKEGVGLSSLSDFNEYAMDHPVAARSFFMSSDFFSWLTAIQYPHTDSYEELTKDPNKERALDNFLIISGLKQKSKIIPISKQVTAVINPYDKNIYTGDLRLVRTGWGYLSGGVTLKTKAKWLKMGKDLISARDFDVNNHMTLSFYISPVFLTSPMCGETVAIDGETVSICARALHSVSARLSKAYAGFGDSGTVCLNNNTGHDIKVEILPEDTFIRFEGRQYLIGKYAEIPFEIRLTGLQATQLRLLKQPVVRTGVHVRTAESIYRFQTRLPLTVGELGVKSVHE